MQQMDRVTVLRPRTSQERKCLVGIWAVTVRPGRLSHIRTAVDKKPYREERMTESTVRTSAKSAKHEV